MQAGRVLLVVMGHSDDALTSQPQIEMSNTSAHEFMRYRKFMEAKKKRDGRLGYESEGYV